MRESTKRFIGGAADIAAVIFVFPAALILKMVRRVGVQRVPLCKKVLLAVGVFPIRAHYYEPQFDLDISPEEDRRDRSLPGIDWNVEGQLHILDQFRYAGELKWIGRKPAGETDYYSGNGSFDAGDAEFWYQMIRWKKPLRIFEIGSGYSTLMGLRAVQQNAEEDPAYHCRQVCIEPYEMPWLEKTGLEIIRSKVEDLDVSFFGELEADDILFIDSSHMVRPQGDVLFEFLQILPILKPGVVVHFHDIFSPRNYPKQWLQDAVRFWNEQYLLEAFLSGNTNWQIIGAVNFLNNRFPERIKAIAPLITPDRGCGSFYIQKLR